MDRVVTLTDEDERNLATALAGGGVASAEAAVAEGLRLLAAREAEMARRRAWLIAEADRVFGAVDRREMTVHQFETDDELDDFIRKNGEAAIARGLARRS